MGDSAESLAKDKINNIPFSPFICVASHLIVEGCWVVQARFSLVNICCQDPAHAWKLFPDYLFHHLPIN